MFKSSFNVLSPSRGAELIRSLIDIYKHDGYTPDGRSANQNGKTQGGSNSDVLMADAYVKGVHDRINWDDAFAAMVKNAEVTPPYWYDFKAPDASTKEGRGDCPIGLALGMFHVIIQDLLREQWNSHMMILRFRLWLKESAMTLLMTSI